MAVDVEVYPGRVVLTEVSRHQHRQEVLPAAAHDLDGTELAAAVVSWVAGTDAVYLSEHGNTAGLHQVVREALAEALVDADTDLRTTGGRAADHVVGDVPIRGGKAVRPADEAAVMLGEPPEGFRHAGEPAAAAGPLEPKPIPSAAESVGTTHAHHAGGDRLRTTTPADSPLQPAGDHPAEQPAGDPADPDPGD